MTMRLTTINLEDRDILALDGKAQDMARDTGLRISRSDVIRAAIRDYLLRCAAGAPTSRPTPQPKKERPIQVVRMPDEQFVSASAETQAAEDRARRTGANVASNPFAGEDEDGGAQ